MRAPSLPSLLLLPLLLPSMALLALPCSASAFPSVPAPEEDDGAVTVLGTGVLRKSSSVVRATIERVSTLSLGIEVGTLRPREVLWGEEELRGDGAALHAVRLFSNEQGFLSRVSADAIFFLVPMEGADRYESAAIVDLSGAEGPARLDAVRRSLRIERLPASERAAALRRACFESLGAPDAWTRQNAGREIAHLAVLLPGTFSRADARDLRRLASREAETALRPLLVETAEVLGRAAARGELAPEDVGERVSLRGAPAHRALREGTTAKERLEALEEVRREGGAAAVAAIAECLLKDADPAVRGAAAGALTGVAGAGSTAAPRGEGGPVPLVPGGPIPPELAGTNPPAPGASTRAGSAPEAPRVAVVEALLASLEGEKVPAVRAACVEGLGNAGAAGAVPLLRRLCEEERGLTREALFALARIGTPAATAALRDFRAGSALSARDDAAPLRTLVDFLLSDDFLKQEEALRRLRENADR